MALVNKLLSIYWSLNEKLDDGIYNDAVSYFIKNAIHDPNTFQPLYTKSSHVLMHFDKNLHVMLFLFAKQDIRIYDKTEMFDLWLDYDNNQIIIRGFAPKLEKFNNIDEYKIELFKSLRQLSDDLTFGSLYRLPVNQINNNMTKLLTWKISTILQNRIIYGLNNITDESYITNADKMALDILNKLLRQNPSIRLSFEQIIEAIDTKRIKDLKRVLPKNVFEKLSTLLNNFGKLDLEYFEALNTLLDNLSNPNSNSNGIGFSIPAPGKGNSDNQQNNNNSSLDGIDNQQIQNIINYGLSKYLIQQDMIQNPNKNQINQALTNLMKNLQHKLQNEMESLKERGILSNDAFLILKKILKVKVNWEELLQNVIGSRLEQSLIKSWHRPKKHLMHIVYLPGYVEKRTIDKVTIFIDTSASMSDKELMKALGVIYDLATVNKVKKILVVQHDSVLKKYDEYEVEYLSSPEEIVKQIKIVGRGGTSHLQPLNQLLNKQKMDLGELIIFISDFYSDFEEAYNKILKPNGIDFVCITTEAIPEIDTKRYPVVKIERN